MATIRRNRPTATSADALAGTDGHRVMTPERVREYASQFGLGYASGLTGVAVTEIGAAADGLAFGLVSSMTDGPDNVSSGFVLEMDSDGSSFPAHLLVNYSANELWFRRRPSEAWQKVWGGTPAIFQVGSSGYQMLPSGVMLQWGALTTGLTGDVNDGGVVNFPMAFANQAFGVQLTLDQLEGAESSGVYVRPGSLAVTGFKWSADNLRSGNILRYMAMGY